MYDYQLTSHLSNGGIKKVGYQEFLTILEMRDEISHGVKLSAGGVPQVISFCQIVKKLAAGIEKITISYNGEIVASV
jgi:hypothetical protein